MRIVRYADSIEARYGVLEGEVVHEAEGDLAGGFTAGKAVGHRSAVALLTPCEPAKILCVGRNYAEHIKEMGRDWPTQPFIFLKPPNSVVGPDAPVLRPAGVERFEFEGEMAVVIGRRASRVRESDWRGVVAGYTCANDMTVRDWQNNDGQWARAKGADTLCPLGPWIETDIADPQALRVQTRVNGETRQDGTTEDFVFGIGALLAFVTEHITLEPGDAVLTGTPGGVGPVDDGDVMEVEVEGVGILRNPVRARA